MFTLFRLAYTENNNRLGYWSFLKNDKGDKVNFKIFTLFQNTSFLLCTGDDNYYYFDVITLELLCSSSKKPFSDFEPLRRHLRSMQYNLSEVRKKYVTSKYGLSKEQHCLN
ncbi:MAG: hypothetical protein HEQ40_12060 [Lacibacter sp.]